MMARNVEAFIGAAITPLRAESRQPWELVVIDDHSDDRTFDLVAALAASDPRIRLYRNPHRGKVRGTNYGYSLAQGEIIKCIDSDDVLLPEYFDFARRHQAHDVLFHSGTVTDEQLRPIVDYHPSHRWMTHSFPNVAEELVSFPKWTWSMRRTVADRVFPLPEALPFEDVWMSLLCKKHARHAGFTRTPLYLYRQHAHQTFGGILNFSREASVFRAKRLLDLLKVLEAEPQLMDDCTLDFSRIRRECEILAGERSVGGELLAGGLSLRGLARIALEGRAPGLLRWLVMRRWATEGKVE